MLSTHVSFLSNRNLWLNGNIFRFPYFFKVFIDSLSCFKNVRIQYNLSLINPSYHRGSVIMLPDIIAVNSEDITSCRAVYFSIKWPWVASFLFFILLFLIYKMHFIYLIGSSWNFFLLWDFFKVVLFFSTFDFLRNKGLRFFL